MSGRQTLAPRPRGYEDTAEWVPRFGLTERFAHWWTVSTLAAALLTGLAMGDEAESGPLLTVHVTAVILIGVGLVLALILGNTKALLAAAFRLFTFDRRDVTWVRDHLRPSGEHGEWGMFNPGQKLLAWALTIAVAVVIYTGIESWSAGGEDNSAHGIAAIVAMSLVGGHIFMAALNPMTAGALNGMLLGRVRRSWAAQHHSGWLHDLDRGTRLPRR